MTTTIRRGTRAWSQLRAQWQDTINRLGSWPCRRCHQPIRPGDEWDLGHDTPAALGGTHYDAEPEHRRQCNRAAGGRLSHQLHQLRTESSSAL